jgi:hypothetical protein
MSGLHAVAMLLAGIMGGLACQDGPAAKASAAIDSAASVPLAPAPKPVCSACALEDQRLAAHKDQVVASGRYLGLKERWLDEQRTSRRCTRDAEVMGVVRFALVGENPWRDDSPARPTRGDEAQIVEVNLPCPELSRPQYAKLYQYDPDDSERDGLGHAPVLRQRELFRLTLVRGLGPGQRMPTLVAVNP